MMSEKTARDLRKHKKEDLARQTARSGKFENYMHDIGVVHALDLVLCYEGPIAIVRIPFRAKGASV